MREWAKGVVKKVTLELVYEVVEERSKSIYEKLEKIEKRQEEDFRYLNQKIDTQIGQVRQEIGQLRQEIGQLRQEMGQVRQELRKEINQLRQEMREEMNQLRHEISGINNRIDTLIQIMLERR